jgi:hypothetical protein
MVPMSAIATAANSSAYSAVALLLSNAASSATTQVPNSTTSGAAASSASSAPIDRVNLSDNAKATLARAQTDQVAADKLAAQVQAARDPTGKNTAPKTSSSNGPSLFDQLTGRGQSPPSSAGDFESATLTALLNTHTLSDGSVQSFSVTASDVLTPVSTPQQIADWYKTNATSLINDAQSSPSAGSISLAQAVQNHQVTFQSAADIPGLDFHNTYTFQGGNGGSSVNQTFTYNQNAAIFQDPTNNYLVSSDGTVISWPKMPASATATAG